MGHRGRGWAYAANDGADDVRDSTPMGRIGFAYDGFERFPLCVHADVRVMLKHLFRDVPGDVANGFVSSPALGKIGDQRMSGVVPAPADAGLLPNVVPRRL